MRIFRPGPGPYALTEAMTGVRLGERLVYLGAGDPKMFAALALKVGVTGRARAIVESEASSERVKEADARAAVFIEGAAEDLAAIDLEAAAFDVAVVDATGGAVLRLDGPGRSAVAVALFRALRPRGRAVVVEREKRGLLAALQSPSPDLDRFRSLGGAAGLLEGPGFRPVRLLADSKGQRFTEGWKPPQ